MGLIRPGRLTLPPQGLLRPNREAVSRGLVFLQAFANGPHTPFVVGGAVPGAFVSGASVGLVRGGQAMVGVGGYWRAPVGAGTTFTMPTTRGTVLWHGFTTTASGDPVFNRRYLWAIGNAASWPASPWCGLADFDNSLIGGWVNGGVDGRASGSSASGAAWAANSSPVVALTYGPSGQAIHANGVQIGANGFNNFGSTASGIFAVGDAEITIPYARNTGDATHYLMILSTEVPASDRLEMARDPWWWVERPRLRVARKPLSVIAHTATPGPGQITLTGRQPLVRASATLSPGFGQMAWQGAVPTIRAGASPRPGFAALTWQGRAVVAIGGSIAGLPPGQRSYSVTLPARAYAASLAARAYTVTLPPRSYS